MHELPAKQSRDTGPLDDRARGAVFWAGWSIAAALLAGLIWNARPYFSPNDRSRWNTVWSLVEFGTYQIFDTPEEAAKWNKPVQLKTIDKVQRDGKFYSSKPPLLPTVIAGWVHLLRLLVGQEFSDVAPNDPGKGSIQIYAKGSLFLFQLAPFLLMLVLYRRYLDRHARTDFCWAYCLLAATAGTLVTGYLTTLNNHVIAASFAFCTLYLIAGIYDGRREWWRFLLAGLATGWTFANELPAGLLVLAASLLVLWIDWRKALFAYAPALAVVLGAMLYTNYEAFGTWQPAYLQKEWYQYPGSYWIDPQKKSGIDALNDNPESYAAYFLHMTVGHHGWFSLSPIWILALWGLVLRLRESSKNSRPPQQASVASSTSATGRVLAGTVLLVWLGVFAFFWLVTDQRNYGGFCHGMRWLMWLAPLWLLFLPPAVDRIADNPRHRRVAWACLIVSVFSMADTLYGPWSYSWLHRVLWWFGLVAY